MQKDADQDVKSELLDNYEDHVYLKQYNEHNQVLLDSKAEEQKDFYSIQSVQRFFAICKTANSKPYWQGYSEKNDGQDEGFRHHLPSVYTNAFIQRSNITYDGENISCHFIPLTDSLPKFNTRDKDDGSISLKSYKVP